VLSHGEGAWITDVTGRRYLDLMSAYSAVSFGHAHPDIIGALVAQAGELAVTSRAFFNDRLPLLLERVTRLTGLPRAIPSSGGAEAVETSLKAVRKWAYKVKGVPAGQAEVIVCRNNFHGRDKVLTIDAYASTFDYTAYNARTTSLVASLERLSTLLYQKTFSWSLGVELTASGEQQKDAQGNPGPRQTYFIGSLPLYAQFDTSDNLLNPTKGFRLSAHIAPETSRTNSTQSYYVRAQGDASYYLSVSKKIVLAARVRVATISGAPLSAIAPSRRLYAGGADSVRGYGYQSIGPRDNQGDPTGGRSLVEASAEARIQTPWLGGALGFVPFVDAGTVGAGTTPSFNEIKIGAGVGLRYNTSFGPVRLDVGIPLNRGKGDGPVGVYVGLGQAF